MGEEYVAKKTIGARVRSGISSDAISTNLYEREEYYKWAGLFPYTYGGSVEEVAASYCLSYLEDEFRECGFGKQCVQTGKYNITLSWKSQTLNNK